MPHSCKVEFEGSQEFSVGELLDVRYLEEVSSHLVEASVAPSTKKTCLSGHGQMEALHILIVCSCAKRETAFIFSHPGYNG